METNQPLESRRVPGEAALYALLLSALLIPLYIYSLPPGLPPYRDSGEMASAAWTLGVAHQPGYPLYLAAARLFSMLPLGNPAWRLNLFSAAAGLAGVFALWRLAAAAFSPAAGLFAALLLGFNFTLRTVSSVPEMYALNFLFAAALLACASGTGRRALYLSAFLLGLGMANRMDLVLCAPALLVLLWPGLRAAGLRGLAAAGGLFLLGFSFYLYLPLRSSGWPVFDWSHPADAATFLAVITRKSYGSTLDLISANYAPGALFWPNLKAYAAHLWGNFGPGLAFAAYGAWAEWRSDRRRLAAFAVLFAVAGPVFLYMANMPPNPHALAIVEPYYLLPDLAAAFWAAAGLWYAAAAYPKAARGLLLAAALSAAFVLWHNARGTFRRGLFAAEDYASDAMRSVPPGSVLVAKKDVQLFSLWYLQSVLGLRPDIEIVAQGLSGSPWYRASKARYSPDLALVNLNGAGEAEWKAFAAANRGRAVYATMDVELPDKLPAAARGIVNEIFPGPPPAADPWLFYSYSRLARPYRDFFDKDLGVSYAQGLMAGAAARSASGGIDRKWEARLELASALDPDLPDAPLYEGLYFAAHADWPAARDRFLASARVYGRLQELAREYYSLPALTASLAAGSAYAWLNYGVALEKTGDKAGAEAAYTRALQANPRMADAHYNLAILYWNRDWDRVRSELEQTVRLNPAHPTAGRYLAQLRGR